MFKYSNLKYDEFYSSEHCERENTAIRSVLDAICDDKETVLDLGAGTGLVASMLGERCFVMQVEKDAEMQKQNPYPHFHVGDAYEFVAERVGKPEFEYDHVVSLFAVNYMPKGTMTLACELACGECVFVVYDKPYKAGSSSYYAKKPFEFWLKNWRSVLSIEKEIRNLRANGYSVDVHNLLNEPYYKMIRVWR